MRRVSFHELAEHELNDAALYYEQESTGLGVRFLDEVERYIETILKNPYAGRKVRGQVRRRILRTFPYGILLGEGRRAARRFRLRGNLALAPLAAERQNRYADLTVTRRAKASTLVFCLSCQSATDQRLVGGDQCRTCEPGFTLA